MDFSDLSDLTDLSDDYGTKNSNSKPKTKGKTAYEIKNALRPPRTAQYTAKHLYEQVVDNQIDLNPEYQRDVVWPEAKQTGLIDSILRNYYIPPIIFSVSSASDGSESRTCIDGKQRLTSIQRFFDGMTKICRYTNQKLWFKSDTSNRKQLSPEIKRLFSGKQITCVEYENLTQDQEREMFQRVQLGVALTPAERLQAITGPFPTLVRSIQSMIAGESGFEHYMDWSTTRGRDFQSIASVLFLVYKIPSQSFPTSAALDKWLQSNAQVEPALEKAALETFRRFIALVRNKDTNTPFTRPTRVSPIEFVMIGLLIFMLRTKSTDKEISESIRDMRTDVRKKHTDIRTNGKVTKTMFTFINECVSERGKSGSAGKKGATAKRKRDESSDEDSDDESDEEPLAKIQAKRVAGAASMPQKPATTKTTNTNISVKKTAPGKTSVKQEVASDRVAISSRASAATQPVPRSAARPTPQTPRVALPSTFAAPPSVSALPRPAAPPPPSTAPRSSTSKPPAAMVKVEAPADFFAALRQAKASASTATNSPTAPPPPTPRFLGTTPQTTPALTKQHSSLPNIQTSFNGPAPTQQPGGPANLTSENVAMFKNLAMLNALNPQNKGSVRSPQSSNTPFVSANGHSPNSNRNQFAPPMPAAGNYRPPGTSSSITQTQHDPTPSVPQHPIPPKPPTHYMPPPPPPRQHPLPPPPRYTPPPPPPGPPPPLSTASMVEQSRRGSDSDFQTQRYRSDPRGYDRDHKRWRDPRYERGYNGSGRDRGYR